MKVELLVIGFNHRTAPVDVRERLCFSGPDLETLLQRVRTEGADEVAVLSTCNRTEIYVAASSRAAAERAARPVLAEADPFLLVLRDRDAAEHLFRVASGLDSAVLGETEILGQVRRALEAARQAGTAGRVLTALFQQAIQTGKRVRTQTAISRHSLSSASLAVKLAREVTQSLAERTALLIGTGSMATQIAQLLQKENLARLIVASSTQARAETFVADWSRHFAAVQPVAFSDLPSVLGEADLVIAATNTAEPVLKRDAIERAVAERSRILVIADLGVPRNIDPAARSIDRVRFADLGDLASVVEANLGTRRNEIAAAGDIVSGDADAFLGWLQELAVHPLIVGMRGRAEMIRATQLEEALRRLGHLSTRDREVVESLTQSIVQKLLHTPTIRLKERAREARAAEIADAVRDLFNLERTP